MRSIAAVLELLLPALALAALDAHGVARVSDFGAIPGAARPGASSSAGSASLVTGAPSVAAIVLVQGAGVRESSPAPGGKPWSVDGDFAGQGVGNILSGLLRGRPVGDSVGQTALSLASSARSRWATILSGCWLLVSGWCSPASSDILALLLQLNSGPAPAGPHLTRRHLRRRRGRLRRAAGRRPQPPVPPASIRSCSPG